MFCSFAKSPRILRFFCTGKVVEWDDPKFEALLQRMGKERIEGARAVISLDVFKVRVPGPAWPFLSLRFKKRGQVQTSCGFGVPLLTTAPMSEDATSGEASPILLDRDTMGHWSHRKIETNTLLDWQAEYNSSSLDGCPGMRSAMRDHGDRVWVTLLKARIRRIGTQTEAVLVGIVLGVALLAFAQVTLRSLGLM